MSTTPNLSITHLAPAQSQKHVTVNEAINVLDCAVQCAVLEMSRTSLPVEAKEGDRYLLSATPDEEWSDMAKMIADWQNGGWVYIMPKRGWRLYNLADDTLYMMNRSRVWTALSGPTAPTTELQNLTCLGLGTTANAANPFVAKVNSALWTARTTAEGGTGDLFVTTNRSDGARNVGHLFQTGFITRAMAGLFESDQFRIKVSSGDEIFRDALVVDDATGIADLPGLPRFKAYTDFNNYGAITNWTRIGINTVESNDQGAFDAGQDRNWFKAPVAGTYMFGATVLYKINTSTAARLRVRLVRNGAIEIRGSFTELVGPHVSLATAAMIQTMVVLAKDETVALEGSFAGGDGYFAADHTSFWGYKVG